MEITVRNVNEAVGEGFWRLHTSGVRENSRNGPVIVLPEPLSVTYERPQERVLFWPERDANHFFHFMECLWMLAGRNDVEFIRYFNGKIDTYSDDGETFNGAYGHRWRNRFGIDQVANIIEHLEKNPESRRAVLTMWGTQEDLAQVDDSKDVPCNTQAYFDLRGGALNMTVTNRSNDMIWGMFGANAVHFSFLQEFIASALGVRVGRYTQFSNNVHLYTELYDYAKYIEAPPHADMFDGYRYGVSAFPILSNKYLWRQWLEECERFCDDPFNQSKKYFHPIFSNVARPMALAYKERKDKKGNGLYWVSRVLADDWRTAATEWIERREYAKHT